jgi:hypothetical protein
MSKPMQAPGLQNPSTFQQTLSLVFSHETPQQDPLLTQTVSYTILRHYQGHPFRFLA